MKVFLCVAFFLFSLRAIYNLILLTMSESELASFFRRGGEGLVRDRWKIPTRFIFATAMACWAVALMMG